ncbi:MAG: hypothetical protein ACREP6_11365, partial [Candidatus Binataceae bacterium]
MLIIAFPESQVESKTGHSSGLSRPERNGIANKGVGGTLSFVIRLFFFLSSREGCEFFDIAKV